MNFGFSQAVPLSVPTNSVFSRNVKVGGFIVRYWSKLVEPEGSDAGVLPTYFLRAGRTAPS